MITDKELEQLKNKVLEAKRVKRETRLLYRRAGKALRLAKGNYRHGKELQKSEQVLQARRGLVDDMLKSQAKQVRHIKVEEAK